MTVQKSEFRSRGRSHFVPTCSVQGREVIAVGRWLRIATLKDEEWLDGEPIANLGKFVEDLRASGLPADIFALSGPIDGSAVEGGNTFETDNLAVIRTDRYSEWWENLPQATRKNARRSEKKGIQVRLAKFNDEFVAGIKTIYDETPIRQGRKFWHYGKDLETIKRENSTYLDRSEFIGAYYGEQLVGFIKFVYVNDRAIIMQILCLDAHQDKRPIIALVVKAVDVCHAKGIKYFIYGKYTYGRKGETAITEFKRRLGFEKLEYRRYFTPLSFRGAVALRCGVHRGLLALLPAKLINYLLSARAWWLSRGIRQTETSKAE